MVDPDVRDWERLRNEIPAIEVASIDEQMQVYLDAAAEEELEGYDENGYALKVSKEDVDAVNNPSHYNTGSVECIEAIEASMSCEGFKSYCKGNVQKYLWRYEMKGKPVEDLQKAQWYLAKLLNVVIFKEEDE
jgi:hypothetical protein